MECPGVGTTRRVTGDGGRYGPHSMVVFFRHRRRQKRNKTVTVSHKPPTESTQLGERLRVVSTSHVDSYLQELRILYFSRYTCILTLTTLIRFLCLSVTVPRQNGCFDVLTSSFRGTSFLMSRLFPKVGSYYDRFTSFPVSSRESFEGVGESTLIVGTGKREGFSFLKEKLQSTEKVEIMRH